MRESGVEHLLRQLHLKGVLLVDDGDLAVHVEDLLLIEAEALHDVVEGVGVDGLFKGLAQEVLPALGVGDVPEDRQRDVVGYQALCRRKEAEIAHDHMPLVRRSSELRHNSISLAMGTSLGIQWLAHPVR